MQRNLTLAGRTQVKVFVGKPVGPIWASKSAGEVLEQSINKWLADNPSARIIDIHQSRAGGELNPATFLVSVWYEMDL